MGPLFFSCRGAKDGFFRSFSLFACFLANSSEKFPGVCSKLISAGALTPLNKVAEEERKQRDDAALPPKLRPINSGSLLAKTVLKTPLSRELLKRLYRFSYQWALRADLRNLFTFAALPTRANGWSARTILPTGSTVCHARRCLTRIAACSPKER